MTNSKIALDIQAKLALALKDLRALDVDSSVSTRRLAKRIRRLGVKSEASEISVELEAIANTRFGRSYSSFIGGTPDPLNQHTWALPAQQE
jgi:hypothetical protein